MSLIQEFRSTEASIAELQSRLAALKSDPKLEKELEFEGKLRDLLAEYGKSLRDIITLLDPQRVSGKAPKASSVQGVVRRPRSMKTYRNPHTGEVVETKGGNHKTLNEWKQQYGADAVKSWADA